MSLLDGNSSLWVDWVKTHLMRQESFWDIKDIGLGSWVWRKLLQLRATTKQFIRMEVHSGQSMRFWTDLWHPLGRLIEVVGEIGTQKLGIARTALVCDVRNDGHWRFRRFRNRHMKDFIQAIENDRLEEDQFGQDVVLWRMNDTEFGKGFTTSETWQKIRIHSPAVPWSKVVYG
ncbi:uncharacterized protein LOC125576149 [Brassica napus]|uniref:uncharacterized protein LOC125576149 n=1 Tax=Brassica napus TaxID=3708 RepID=UPI0020790EC2|nr:uncharacterized protein LOC125576149 [Brassica napus]